MSSNHYSSLQEIHYDIANEDSKRCQKCLNDGSAEMTEDENVPRSGFPVRPKDTEKYRIIMIGSEPGGAKNKNDIPKLNDKPTLDDYKNRFDPEKNKNTISLLFSDLKEQGVDWNEIFYTNSVKCPVSKDKAENNWQNCKNYLKWQIKLIAPELIIVIGRAASHLKLKKSGSEESYSTNCLPDFKKPNKNTEELEEYPILVIRHPQGAKKTYRKNIAKKAKEFLNST